MNQNKVIIILFLIIVILGLIFVVKVNTVDNNKNTVVTANVENIENTKSSLNNENNNNSSTNSYYTKKSTEELYKERKEDQKELIREVIKDKIVIILIGGIFGILWIAGVYKTSIDVDVSLGYRLICILSLIISTIIGVFSLFNANIANYDLFITIAKLSIIILLYGIYYKVGVNIVLIILSIISVFIPNIGSIISFFMYVYGMWRLGDYYNKSTGYKISLIILNFIELPVMAFNSKKIDQNSL